MDYAQHELKDTARVANWQWTKRITRSPIAKIIFSFLFSWSFNLHGCFLVFLISCHLMSASQPDVTLHWLAAVSTLNMLSFVGSVVAKKFGGSLFEGAVVSYDSSKRWYKVVYSDGDCEEMVRLRCA